MSPVDPDGRICIVGGSLAATTAAGSLRRAGHRGRITLVSAEHVPPYARPPLSKGILMGSDSAESTYLPTPDIELMLGRPVQRLDLASSALVLAGGETVSFDGLVIATGARARPLPGEGDVFVLRSLDDANRLRVAMQRAATMVVVGGGPLAMEIASAATELGIAVTMLTNRLPLQTHLGPELAAQVLEFAENAGVEVVVDPYRFRAARSSDGRTVILSPLGHTWSADLIVAAVGCMPNVEWLAGSGLDYSDNGLVVDEYLRAADRVVAAGDVVALRSRRSPLWLNAIDQATTAATNLLTDTPRPFSSTPFFWTEFFGHRIRVVGTIRADAVTTVDPTPQGTLVKWCANDGRVEAVAALDLPMPVGRLKRLVDVVA